MQRNRWPRCAVLLWLLPADSPAQVPVETIPVPAESEARREMPVPWETIEVTGSHIRRPDYETHHPIQVITRDEIDRTGHSNLGDLLQEIAIAGSAAGQVGGFGPQTEIDLRNLGSERVLVLVNGRRWIGGLRDSATSAVDLNTIPLSAISRVEILKDGASAIYGSDAVAGVVNVITRKAFEGFVLRSSVADFAESGGNGSTHNVSFGRLRGATSVFADVAYSTQGVIPASAWAVSSMPRFGTGHTRGLPVTPRGTLAFVPTPENGEQLGEELCPTFVGGETALGPLPVPSGVQVCQMILRHGETITGAGGETTASVASRYEAFDQTSLDPAVNDFHNDALDRWLLRPSERESVFATLEHGLGDDLSLDVEALYQHRRATVREYGGQLILVGDLVGILPPRWADLYVAADNPFNPFDQDIGRADVSAPVANAGPGSGVIARLATELGALDSGYKFDTYRLAAGLEGERGLLGRPVSWQSGVTYSQNREHGTVDNAINLNRLRLGIGPLADCAATPDCVPVNLFGGALGAGALSPAMLDYISYDAIIRQRQELVTVHAHAAHDVLELPAGPLGMAYGFELREEEFAGMPDALIAAGATNLGASLPTHGKLRAREVFAELSVPAVAGVPLAEVVELTLAARHSDHGRYGRNTSEMLGLRWKPVGSVLVRGTASTPFRVPAISDLYLVDQGVSLQVEDPCSDYAGVQGGPAASPTVQENCSSQGVPETYTQLFPYVLGRPGGNPDLMPESATTYTAGVVFNPPFVPGLNLYLDWYRIRLADAITILSPQFIVDSCYETPGGSEPCALVSRDPDSGSINEIRLAPLNIAALGVEGFDFNADFRHGLPEGFGSMVWLLDSSYLVESTLSLTDGNNTLRRSALQGQNTGFAAYPRVKANLSARWEVNRWSMGWRARYIHHQSEPCDDGLQPSFTELGLCSEPDAVNPDRSRNTLRAITYHDLQLGYSLPAWSIGLVAGVHNLFGEEPPPSYAAALDSFDPATYEIPGRLVYFRLTASF